VEAGQLLENKGDYAEALREYRSAEEIDPVYAELQFRIARCLFKLGQFEEAKQKYIAAQELDTLRFRADKGINDAIRSVAKDKLAEGEFVDAASLLADASPNGITGSELFFEHVHLKPHGNYLLAQAVYAKVAGLLDKRFNPGSGAGGQAAALTEDDCNRMLALTSYDRARLAGEMHSRMQRPPFTNQVNNAEQLAGLESEAQDLKEADGETVAEYNWALTQNPDDPMLHQKAGLFLYRFNRSLGIAELRKSRPYHDTPLYMPDGTRVE